jgi:DeoR/GlpR family transcriptional regulator of sugar metabolism
MRRGQLPTERRLEILELVRTRPIVRADELADHFGVSVETVRRDLIALERDGRTKRVYGGVTKSNGSSAEAPYEERRVAHEAEKEAMAGLAASLVEPGDMLLLDVGTSVARVASRLPMEYTGTVLTNSLVAATVLAGRQGIELLTSGGRVRPGDLACSGPATEAFFDGFFGGKAFLGSGGVHPNLGLTDYYPDEIATRRIMIDHANACYVLADSSKLGKVAMARVCDLSRVTAVITDDGVDEPTAKAFEQAGVQLLVAAVPRSAEAA